MDRQDPNFLPEGIISKPSRFQFKETVVNIREPQGRDTGHGGLSFDRIGPSHEGVSLDRQARKDVGKLLRSRLSVQAVLASGGPG